MRDAVAINQSRHPAQQEPGPSSSAMGSQIRLGEIADLRTAHDELKRQLDKMKEEAAQGNQPLERLQEQIDGLVEERDDLVARLNNANKTITKEKKQFETAQAMIDNMTGMNNKIQEKYDNLRTTYKELQGRWNSRQLVPDTQDAESQSEVLAGPGDEIERLTTERSASEAAGTSMTQRAESRRWRSNWQTPLDNFTTPRSASRQTTERPINAQPCFFVTAGLGRHQGAGDFLEESEFFFSIRCRVVC